MPSPVLLVYLPYAVIAISLTIWLARTLSRHGGVFLATVFPDKPELANAINQLLVIGFYLVNIGWALLLVRTDALYVTNATQAVSMLLDQLGVLLLLLGLAHFFNLYVFHRIGRGARAA